MPGGAEALAHVPVQRRVLGRALEARAPVAAEAFDRRRRQGKLTRREHPDLGDGAGRALAFGVEGAQAVDLVVQPVDAVRGGAAHGEHVHDGAAQRIVPMLDHLGHGPITAADQALAKRVAIHPLAGAEQERLPFEEGSGRQPLHEGRHRGDHDAPLELR